jgi:hypothetical protein
MKFLFKKSTQHMFLISGFLLSALLLSSTDDKGIRTLWTLHKETQRVAQEISSLQTRLDTLTNHIDRFHFDAIEQERIVRLQTGYLKPNELLIEWL